MDPLDFLRFRRALIAEARSESDPRVRELIVHQVIQLDVDHGCPIDWQLLEWGRSCQGCSESNQ